MTASTILGLIPYPDFDPIAIAIGPFAVRWYALAYIVGLLVGWRFCLWLAKSPPGLVGTVEIDDFLTWATVGVVLGGRIGYVLFYQSDMYLQDPKEIFMLWHGGMSFHGGCAGVTLALWLFARKRRLSMLALADIVTLAVPIGLFFGRLANFVNGELWGRPTDVPWAMIFPTGGPVPRHPSQLYEAGMEGVLLFLLLLTLELKFKVRMKPGRLTGVFLLGYAVARTVGELFREPDAQLGFLFFGTTMGQLLSVPLILGGLWLILRAKPGRGGGVG